MVWKIVLVLVIQKRFGYDHAIRRGFLYKVLIEIHWPVWCNQGQSDKRSWIFLVYSAIGFTFMGVVSP